MGSGPNAPIIWNSAIAKLLTSVLGFVDGTTIQTGTTTPTSSAVSASKGSMYLNTSTGLVYIKLDAGSSTNWAIILASASGASPVVRISSSLTQTFANNVTCTCELGSVGTDNRSITSGAILAGATLNMTSGTPNATVSAVSGTIVPGMLLSGNPFLTATSWVFSYSAPNMVIAGGTFNQNGNQGTNFVNKSITIPTTGIYVFSSSFAFNPTNPGLNSSYACSVWKNTVNQGDSGFLVGIATVVGTLFQVVNGQLPISCTAGDVITPGCRQNTGATQPSGGSVSISNLSMFQVAYS